MMLPTLYKSKFTKEDAFVQGDLKETYFVVQSLFVLRILKGFFMTSKIFLALFLLFFDTAVFCAELMPRSGEKINGASKSQSTLSLDLVELGSSIRSADKALAPQTVAMMAAIQASVRTVLKIANESMKTERMNSGGSVGNQKGAAKAFEEDKSEYESCSEAGSCSGDDLMFQMDDM